MPPTFDAYYTWLGIPPDEQPPNHYRLLGIRLFEPNQDVIAYAADRQMMHLRTLQAGERASLCQQLLNRVSAAKVCLLDPSQKAAYDDRLRAETATPGGQASVSGPIPATVAPATTADPHTTPAFSLQHVWLLPATLLGGMLIVLLGAGLLMYMLSDDDENKGGQANPGAASSPNDKPNRMDDNAAATANPDRVAATREIVLSQPPPQVVEIGQSLKLQLRLQDPNRQRAGLTWRLESGAPDGATIDTKSGLFQWTPSSGQTLGTYAIGFAVADADRASARGELLVDVLARAAQPSSPKNGDTDTVATSRQGSGASTTTKPKHSASAGFDLKVRPTLKREEAPSFFDFDVSPDGSSIVALSDGRMTVWEIESGRILRDVSTAPRTFNWVRFAGNSNTVAVAAANGPIELWDLTSAKQLRLLPPGIHKGIMSPGGRYLAAREPGNEVKVWSLEPDAFRAVATCAVDDQALPMPAGMAFYPNGVALVTGGRRVTFWRLEDNKNGQLEIGGRVLKFSPDGSVLAILQENNSIALWDIRKNALLTALRGHDAPVATCAFSPDGRLLATGERANGVEALSAIRLWDLQSGACVVTTAVYPGQTAFISFNHTGSVLVAGREAGNQVYSWDVVRPPAADQLVKAAPKPSEKPSVPIAPGDNPDANPDTPDRLPIVSLHRVGSAGGALSDPHIAALHPAGRIMALSTDSDVRVYRLKPRDDMTVNQDKYIFDEMAVFKTSRKIRPTSIVFARDKEHVVSGHTDGTIRVCNYVRARVIHTIPAFQGYVDFLAMDDLLLACGSQTAIWIDLAARKIVDHEQLSSSDRYLSAAYSENMFATSATGSEEFIYLWDKRLRTPLRKLKGHTSRITNLAFSSDGTALVSMSSESLRIWDAQTGALRTTIEQSKKPFRSFVLALDGRYIVTIDSAAMLKVWKPGVSEPLTVVTANDTRIQSLVADKHGRRLAVGGRNSVSLWEVVEE